MREGRRICQILTVHTVDTPPALSINGSGSLPSVVFNTSSEFENKQDRSWNMQIKSKVQKFISQFTINGGKRKQVKAGRLEFSVIVWVNILKLNLIFCFTDKMHRDDNKEDSTGISGITFVKLWWHHNYALTYGDVEVHQHCGRQWCTLPLWLLRHLNDDNRV